MDEAVAISPFILSLPALVALAFLVLAAVRRFGKQFVGVASIALIVFFYIKEFLNIRGLLLEHHYVIDAKFIHIGKVSPVVVMGHCFTFFTGLLIADRLLALLPSLKKNFALYFVSALTTTLAMAYLMETVGIMAGWWHWLNLDSQPTLGFAATAERWIIAPDIAIKGWALYMGMFFTGFFIPLWLFRRFKNKHFQWLAIPAMFVVFIPVYKDRAVWVLDYVMLAVAILPLLTPLFDWTDIISPRDFTNERLNRLAENGFNIAMAILFFVCGYILIAKADEFDKRAWVAMLPLIGLIVATSPLVQFALGGIACFAAFLFFSAQGSFYLAYALSIPMLFYVSVAIIVALQRLLPKGVYNFSDKNR
ncbi:MAG: hypothetical protein Kow0090_05140 [Myxococcota bacterium]